VAEIDFDAIVKARKLVHPYKDSTGSRRWIAIWPSCSRRRRRGKQVETAVRWAAPPTLESVRFLNEYKGKGIDPGHKSWAFSMVFRAPDRTLTGRKSTPPSRHSEGPGTRSEGSSSLELDSARRGG